MDTAKLAETAAQLREGWRTCRWNCGGRCPFRAAGPSDDACRQCHVPALLVPEVPRTAPMLLICQQPGYRERHSTFFLQPLALAGWRVEVVLTDDTKPFYGVPAAVAKLGIPDAIVQWEEHAVARCTAPWRGLVQWCYERGIVPLSLDFGYFGHYEHFAFDRYLPDPAVPTEIGELWPTLPATVDWDAAPSEVKDYRRRVLRGYAEARQKPPLVEGPYVALYLQQYSLCRLPGADDNNALVARVAEALKARGLRLAVKTAPSTNAPEALTRVPDGVQIFRHEEVPGDTNQRLAVHARYCLIGSSSISNEFILNELPVVALGRSWFNGLGVFYEPPAWHDLPASCPPIDAAARARYANFWLQRQFRSMDAARGLAEILARAQHNRTPSGSWVTCVYAPDRDTEEIAANSLDQSREALPAWKGIAAFDAARPALVLQAVAAKLAVLADSDGQPPRMGHLLRAAVEQAEGDYLFTIEHDVFMDRDQAEAAIAAMERLPRRVAALYLQSVDPQGAPNYPWANDWPRATPFDAEGHFRRPDWPTLSATLWRLPALRQIDWDRVPALEFVDGELGRQLRAMGWECLMTDLARAVHLPHSGRKCLSGNARTLSIGCGGIWAARGIRFGWNGESDLDVRGPIVAALPFDDDTFREIYVGGGLDALRPAELKLFVAEAWRVLRDGGRLDLMTRVPELRPMLGGFRVERDTPARLIAWAVKGDPQ